MHEFQSLVIASELNSDLTPNLSSWFSSEAYRGMNPFSLSLLRLQLQLDTVVGCDGIWDRQVICKNQSSEQSPSFLSRGAVRVLPDSRLMLTNWRCQLFVLVPPIV